MIINKLSEVTCNNNTIVKSSPNYPQWNLWVMDTMHEGYPVYLYFKYI